MRGLPLPTDTKSANSTHNQLKRKIVTVGLDDCLFLAFGAGKFQIGTVGRGLDFEEI